MAGSVAIPEPELRYWGDTGRTDFEGLSARAASGYSGSKRSMGYIVPIVDRILREGASAGSGVKAIVVYPMNALANSQVEELRKFLHFGFSPSERPVTFAATRDRRNQTSGGASWPTRRTSCSRIT